MRFDGLRSAFCSTAPEFLSPPSTRSETPRPIPRVNSRTSPQWGAGMAHATRVGRAVVARHREWRRAVNRRDDESDEARLLKLLQDEIEELFHSPEGDPYATLRDRETVALPLRSEMFADMAGR